MIDYERDRIALQATLDKQKTQAERNRLGQFATPTELAREIVAYGVQLLPTNKPIRFLDPAIGTGAFYSALRQVTLPARIQVAEGFEIDSQYGLPAQKLWTNTPLRIQICDFTVAKPPTPDNEKFNLLICNPPYVRHHHIHNGEKQRLQQATRQASGVQIGGLAGLYCYFLALSHAWLAEDGIAGWLVPSEFMDVNYGRALKQYLLDQVTLLRIHRFDPIELQFEDALVSSAIIWIRKEKPPIDHSVEFTFGGSLNESKLSRNISSHVLRSERKWTRFPINGERTAKNPVNLGDLFEIKRGLATGNNKFFILTNEQIEHYHLPKQFFRPILPSPRYLPHDEVLAEANGIPAILPKLFVLDCRLPEHEVRAKYPTLWSYLEKGKPSVSERYICRHRKPWYSQEDRAPAPFICTYIGRTDTKRARPFRFILNQSQAITANVYLMLYPKQFLAGKIAHDSTLGRRIWEVLNSIPTETFLAEGRVYGGGLNKLEPNELSQVPADRLLALINDNEPHQLEYQIDFFRTVEQ